MNEHQIAELMTELVNVARQQLTGKCRTEFDTSSIEKQQAFVYYLIERGALRVEILPLPPIPTDRNGKEIDN